MLNSAGVANFPKDRSAQLGLPSQALPDLDFELKFPSREEIPTLEAIQNLPQQQLPQESSRPAPTLLKRTSSRGQVGKNSEQNIISRVFTFVCSYKKSSLMLLKLLKKLGLSNSTLVIYYVYAEVLKKCFSRKYHSKKLLLSICTNIDCKAILAIVNSKVYHQELPIERFCQLIRTLSLYYLEELCPRVIIVSKKIHKDAKAEHFKRLRLILQYLRELIQAPIKV